MIAWNTLVARVRAEGENDPSGSDGSHVSWWSGNAVFSVPLEINHDNLASALRSVLLNNGISGSWVSSDAAIMTYLGWSSGQKTKFSFSQTVAWQEELSKPDGNGDKPKKFRKLNWSYGGNKLIDVVVTVNNGAANVSLSSGKKVGMIVFTEGFEPTDIFQLGSYTLNPIAGSGVGNPSTVSIIGGSLANGATQWYPSGNISSEQPNDKSMAKFGTYQQNYAAQPQSVDTVGKWPGNGDGVNLFELRHTTNFLGQIWIQSPGGQIINLPFLPTIETGKNPTVTTTDWRNNRQPVTVNASVAQGRWGIHVERPESSP